MTSASAAAPEEGVGGGGGRRVFGRVLVVNENNVNTGMGASRLMAAGKRWVHVCVLCVRERERARTRE